MKQDSKYTKQARNVMVVIALFASMIYTCAVDSMDNFDIIMYALPCAGLWWMVSQLNKKYEEEVRSENENDQL